MSKQQQEETGPLRPFTGEEELHPLVYEIRDRMYQGSLGWLWPDEEDIADIVEIVRRHDRGDSPGHGTEVVRCVVDDIHPGGAILLITRGPFQLKHGDCVTLYRADGESTDDTP